MSTDPARTSGPYAHTRPGAPAEDWEPLNEHLFRVAETAERFGSAFAAALWGHLAGLWHDLGKYSTAFQGYLRGSSAPGGGHRPEVAGTVDHSTAGAQHAARLGPAGRLLAYCIAGHHAGLPDSEGGRSGLSERLRKQIEPFDAAPSSILAHGLPSLPRLQVSGDRRRAAFSVGFFTRMLFSCLVDADYLATEAFMDPARAGQRPASLVGPRDLLAALDRHLGRLEATAVTSLVNERRREVLAACRSKAALPPGFFSLNVPTGGGKTLSSLAFGLRHAQVHGLRRVVYAIPFTSIIEQTADVFRGALGEHADQVLEHHSNLDPEDPTRQSDRSRLAAENFESPVVVTTNVQLFESLFAYRTSRCRKLHRLAQSVIILDEAQALPPNLLHPTLAALDELVRNYGVTAVLCTATQPAIEAREGFRIGITNIRPIVDDAPMLHRSLRRTRVELGGKLSLADLASRLMTERRALCIVNTRRHASELFKALGDADALHLNANMCGAHRAQVVEEIRRRLKDGRACRVVSTQVIEAGVDVDFPVVYRASAGLDSVAQAAGRCNREGSLFGEDGAPRLGRVVVFDYDDGEFRPPPIIRRATDHFRQVAPDHAADLLAPEAIETYFRMHYWMQGGDDGRGWDRGTGGQSVMRCFGGEDGDPSHHQFRTAADAYQLIDDAQTPVLVPYGVRGEIIIRELEAMVEPPSRRFDRQAQRFVVGVWQNVMGRLVENQLILERHERYYLANPAAYDGKLGLVLDAAGLGIERLIQ